MSTPTMQTAGVSAGRKKAVDESDLDDITLDTSNFKPIWFTAGTNSEKFWHGYGVENNETNVGRIHLDLQTTEPTDVTGRGRLVVFESEDMEFYKAIGPEFNLKTLREDVAESKSDKTMVPTYNPGANNDEVIALEIKSSNADGETVEPSESDFLYQYTSVRQ